jgi:hypothetical protein
MSNGIEFTTTLVAALLVIMWFAGSISQILKDASERKTKDGERSPE